MKTNNIVESKEYIFKKRQKTAFLIKTTREKKGYSQTDLGNLVNCKYTTIGRIESSIYSPNADILYLILKALDLPLKIGNEEI